MPGRNKPTFKNSKYEYPPAKAKLKNIGCREKYSDHWSPKLYLEFAWRAGRNSKQIQNHNAQMIKTNKKSARPDKNLMLRQKI